MWRISKIYPNNLQIEIKQNIPTAIWQEGNQFFTVDNNGVILKEVSSDNVEFELPIIKFSTSTPVIIGNKIIDQNKLQFIVSAQKETDKYFDFQIKIFKIPHNTNQHISAITSEGWEILFSLELNIDDQINNLKLLIKEKLPERKNLNYIDLRLGDRIFYK